MGLHMEGQFEGATKMCEGYMWRLMRKHDQKVYKVHVESHKIQI